MDFKDLGNTLIEASSKITEGISNAIITTFETFKVVWPTIVNVLKGMERKINKRYSRKRFIKLLMSHNIQRNEASKIADKVLKEDNCYKFTRLVKEIYEQKKIKL